jgi:hypothetical protein
LKVGAGVPTHEEGGEVGRGIEGGGSGYVFAAGYVEGYEWRRHGVLVSRGLEEKDGSMEMSSMGAIVDFVDSCHVTRAVA